jgi:adenylylsulfate kinase-like enzyme
MIYVLFGQPESGKTTLGKEICEILHSNFEVVVFHIDGDQLRKILPNKNYTYAGRRDNIKRANTIATYLNHEGCDVVMSLVNPYEELRKELKQLNASSLKFIYLTSDRRSREEHFAKNFEVPQNPDLALNTSELSVKECATKIINLPQLASGTK